ncbi:hypothetical protein O9992_25255 [Vibrio lentus]|nr:hypothetical protein [Vibrio lentus]
MGSALQGGQRRLKVAKGDLHGRRRAIASAIPELAVITIVFIYLLYAAFIACDSAGSMRCLRPAFESSACCAL